MSEGRKTFKAKLYIGDGASPEQFTAVEELLSIAPIGGTKELVDMTSHDTTGYYDYEVFDLKDGNEVACQCIDVKDATGQTLVRTADAAATKDNWRVVDRNGDGYQFPGVVMGLDTDYSDMKGKVLLSFNLKIAGALTPVTVT